MTRSHLAWIVSAWRPRVGLAALLLGLTLVHAGIALVQPLALKRVFDRLQAGSVWPEVGSALWVLGLVAALRFVVYASLQTLRAYGNHRFEHELRSRAFSRLLRLGPSFHTRHATGDTLTRLTNDIGPDSRLPWFLCSGIFRALEAASNFVLVAAGCFWISPSLALACLVPVPLLGIAFGLVSGTLQDRSRRMQEAISAVGAELDQSLQGIRLVQASGAETERDDAFGRAIGVRREAELSMLRAEVGLQVFHEGAAQGLIVLVLLLGGSRVIEGTMSLGDLMAFNAYAFTLAFPIFELGNFVAKLGQNSAIIDRLREIEEWPPDVVDGTGPAAGDSPGAEPGSPRDGLRLESVGFAYRPDRSVLAAVSFEVAPGERVAVVGRVGSGKSTLLRLLVRLMDPTAGRILRRGRPFACLPLVEARAGVGYVPQDPVILSESLRDNIVFGRPGIDPARVEWAARASRLSQDMGAFPQGLDTPVGPRGTRLSGGQKQRLALARALAGGPSLLVMDDCTASLDAATEEAVWEDLARELPGTAIVMVTHRIPVLARVDRIVVLSASGTATQIGTHLELVGRPGEYRDLYRAGELG